MRIALVGPYPLLGRGGSPLDVAGGVERVMHSLAVALSAMEGVETHIIAPHTGVSHYQSVRNGRLHVHYVPAARRWGNVTLGMVDHRRLRRAISMVSPDVIHCHNHLFYPYLFATPPAPTVTSVHGIIREEERFRRGAKSFVRGPARRLWEAVALAHQPNRIYVTDYVRRAVSKGNERLTATILNPVEEAFFEASSHSPEPNTILFVGRVEPRKNVIGLVSALAIVRTAVPDVRLRLVGSLGDSDYVERVHETARRLGIEDRIDTLGFQPFEALVNEYARARVVAAASYEESAGMLFIEGMATARPVVGPDVGGVSEIIEDGETGYVVASLEELASRITEILTTEALARRLGTRGREVARQRFAATQAAASTLDVYRSLLSRESPLSIDESRQSSSVTAASP